MLCSRWEALPPGGDGATAKSGAQLPNASRRSLRSADQAPSFLNRTASYSAGPVLRIASILVRCVFSSHIALAAERL